MSEGGVTYTVKELISMLERTLTDQMNGIAQDIKGLAVKIDSKASDLRVDALENRMAMGEERIGRLEIAEAGNVAVAGYKKVLVGIVVTLTAAGISELIYLLATAGGHG